MAKTYNTFTNVSAGSVLTASDYNDVLENVGNYRVPPMCVLHGGSQSFTGGAPAVFTYTSEVVDTDDMHDNATNTSRITVNTDGLYLFTCQATFQGAGADGSRILMVLLENGSEVPSGGSRVDTGNYGASTALAVNLSLLVPASAGDYYEWRAFSSVNRTADASQFSAVWLGQVS